MARVRVLTMKFPRVTKIGQSIASMRTTPQVSGLGPVTVYIARFKCRAGLDPDRAYLFQLGSAHQKLAPGRARSTRLHCHLFCRAVLDPGRALSICGSVNVAYVAPVLILFGMDHYLERSAITQFCIQCVYKHTHEMQSNTYTTFHKSDKSSLTEHNTMH